MKILLLAPQPFFQDRGTPIAVNLLLKVFSERGDEVDLLTYHEGRDVQHEHVQIHRIISIPGVRGIRPGYSYKKVLCDFFMFLKAVRMVIQKKYDVIHAVEEAAFMALILKWIFRIPYVYDVDSSLPQQLIERYPMLRMLKKIMNFFESLLVRNAKVVAVVCEALSVGILKYHPKKIVVLQDVPLLKEVKDLSPILIRGEHKISQWMIMYVGNLEFYQGMDLLLESFSYVLKERQDTDLVIIGGEATDIDKYRRKSIHLKIQDKVHFIGKKPVELLGAYLAQADILASPRIQGSNTPMKLYSYLASGKAIVATNLQTHTQVLDSSTAILAQPSAEAFGEGLLCLMKDSQLRDTIGKAGKQLVESKYSYEVFCKTLNGLYDGLKQELTSHEA